MNVSEESMRKGRAMRAKLAGQDIGAQVPSTGAAMDAVPGLEELVVGTLFGEVWTRPALEPKSRSLVTMAILTALGKEAQLKTHVGYALNLGWTPEQVREVFFHSIFYSGVPAALNAFRVADEVFREQGRTS